MTMQHNNFERQSVANMIVENERFELQNVASTVEMAASSSKMLQITRKTDRTGSQKNKIEKKKTPQTIPDPFFCHKEFRKVLKPAEVVVFEDLFCFFNERIKTNPP
jgi:hypothetical protein